ncbi:hypothetical protein E1301_Tti019215 [Triplophysa tibetana]|uniref:Uncharacterized protein n=1 Tax=Triplophysa tibetana TaxID=1572043 RepID=A0A5A9PBX1_9TELE|nr:hypothetical protein E1301_Tti019215 [Triplophysa tibetana]
MSNLHAHYTPVSADVALHSDASVIALGVADRLTLSNNSALFHLMAFVIQRLTCPYMRARAAASVSRVMTAVATDESAHRDYSENPSVYDTNRIKDRRAVAFQAVGLQKNRACLASLTISQQPLPRLPAKPPPPPTRPRWDGKEDLNKERDLFFSELLCSNDITSAASSPRFQTPSTFFLLLSLSQASILTEFLHFIIALPPLCHETSAPKKRYSLFILPVLQK